MRLVTLLFILILTSNAHALTYHCDDSCSEQTRGFVVYAFAAWNAALDNTLTITESSDKPDLTISMSDAIAPDLGLTGNGRVLLAVSNAAVVMHEIGHALGLPHSADPDAIMFGYPADIFAFLNQSDVDAVRALYGLSPKTLAMNCRVRRHSVTVLTGNRFATCYWGDGTNSSGWHVSRRLPSGVYQIKLYCGYFLFRQSVSF